MSQLDKLYIAATGMITPVGANSAMTAASVKAGINVYQESPVFNRKYFNMKISSIPDGAFEIPSVNSEKPLAHQSRYLRMLGIAVTALNEIFSTFKVDSPVPLFLGGPEVDSSNHASIDPEFINYLFELSGQNIDVSNSRLLAKGRASGLEAIDLAFEYMNQTDAQYALVGGVDSYIDLYALGTLEMEARTSAVNTSDGFTPGEGAGFLLLSTEEGLSSLSQKPTIEIFRPGSAQEKGHRYSNEPYRGDGLAKAITKALHNTVEKKVKTIFSSMNGESFGTKEHGVALLRNSFQIDSEINMQHPADCFGDLGAATGLVLTGLGAMGLKERDFGSPLLVYCSADKAKRVACCLQKKVDADI